ncbi:hypothetical protein FD19_GL000805 [Lacticaseibacillus thailandensis DSM 22698 = JCM 13996]|uniref:Phosphatidic acid phosphatase type 2/haloperoxidase domain-containing protein n=2 Tax=Lacticaseibacillus thailandensis TaxID=381741 RepID=A0A0R2CE49_9LACO|nr:hypothetical protein FD19_GL000805 [Lacticaseibacillus thailandensis DSM 22698 = JCM 13996]
MTAMLAIAVAITTNQPYLHQFDTWGLHLAGQTTTTRTNWARTITNWGSPVGMVITAIVLALWMLWRRRPTWAATLASAVLATAILNRLVKAVVVRPRPFVADPQLHALAHASGWSFPSGHASASAALVIIMLMYIWRWHRRPATRTLAAIIGVLYLATIVWTRVYLHVHFASDVLAGVLEGVAVAIIAREIMRGLQQRYRRHLMHGGVGGPAG